MTYAINRSASGQLINTCRCACNISMCVKLKKKLMHQQINHLREVDG